jgi:DnaJ family protein C protein 9
MSATTTIYEAFGPDANLYTQVLKLPSDKSATPSQLRKAYYRQALKYHPDKQNGKSEEEVNDAKEKFQAISVAYAVLSDEDRKKTYDETGEIDDSDEGGLDQSNTDAWKDYFKGIFGKVTTADIDKFTETYKCSEEEEADVLKYYRQFKGDLDKMLECVMCSDDIDKKRWVKDYIQPAIDRGDVEDHMEMINETLDDDSDFDDGDSNENNNGTDNNDSPNSDTETEEEEESPRSAAKGKKRKAVTKPKPTKQKAPSRSKPKKKQKKKNESVISDDLVAAIRVRSQGFGSVLAGLEERYATKGKPKKGARKQSRAQPEDIPDDEFEKIQKRLDAQRKR